MKRHHTQKLIVPFPVVETAAEVPDAKTALEVLERLRDKTQAEEWVNPSHKRSVLFGIKLCIATLRKEDINAIT